MEVLVCNCGDCTHWEIVKDANAQFFLVCKSCPVKVPVHVTFALDTNELDKEHPIRWEKREQI
jgi:hypothetical protein